MGVDARAMPGPTADPNAPTPGADLEKPVGTPPETEEPAAGETTGAEPQPGAIPATEPGADEWAKLPEWARTTISTGRRSVRAMKEQLLAHGWSLDDKTGQLIPPEPVAPPRAAKPAAPAEPQTESGLPPEREAYYERLYREAELSDDPERARMKVTSQMGREIAKREAEGALMQGLRTVLPTTTAATVDAYKTRFRTDQQRGEAFRSAEVEFDQVIAEMQAEADAAAMPLLITPKLMEYARAVALDRALPKILAAAGTRKTAQTTTAARTAQSFHTAGGSVQPGGATPPTIDAQEDRILSSLARGSSADKDALTKGYAARKARGE